MQRSGRTQKQGREEAGWRQGHHRHHRLGCRHQGDVILQQTERAMPRLHVLGWRALRVLRRPRLHPACTLAGTHFQPVACSARRLGPGHEAGHQGRQAEEPGGQPGPATGAGPGQEGVHISQSTQPNRRSQALASRGDVDAHHVGDGRQRPMMQHLPRPAHAIHICFPPPDLGLAVRGLVRSAGTLGVGAAGVAGAQLGGGLHRHGLAVAGAGQRPSP